MLSCCYQIACFSEQFDVFIFSCIFRILTNLASWWSWKGRRVAKKWTWLNPQENLYRIKLFLMFTYFLVYTAHQKRFPLIPSFLPLWRWWWKHLPMGFVKSSIIFSSSHNFHNFSLLLSRCFFLFPHAVICQSMLNSPFLDDVQQFIIVS